MEIKCNYTEPNCNFFYVQVWTLQGYLLHWFLSRAASLVLLLSVEESTMAVGAT